MYLEGEEILDFLQQGSCQMVCGNIVDAVDGNADCGNDSKGYHTG